MPTTKSKTRSHPMLTPNVVAELRRTSLGFEDFAGIEAWALEAAAEITEQTVPQVSTVDSSNMLYMMPAGLKVRLTSEIARALMTAADRRKKGSEDPPCCCPECRCRELARVAQLGKVWWRCVACKSVCDGTGAVVDVATELE